MTRKLLRHYNGVEIATDQFWLVNLDSIKSLAEIFCFISVFEMKKRCIFSIATNSLELEANEIRAKELEKWETLETGHLEWRICAQDPLLRQELLRRVGKKFFKHDKASAFTLIDRIDLQQRYPGQTHFLEIGYGWG